jgi:hypothetical protein
MTAFSRLSRFGMTFKPLTADRGEALLMSYLEAFPVKTSVLQGEETGLKESDQAYGEKWHGWLAKFDPNTSSLKTAQCSLLEEEPELLQILPRSGMTRSGTLWERQTLVRRINATESGLWRTPDTGAGGTSGILKNGHTHRSNGQPIQIRLVDQVANPRLWPTPTARIWKGGGEKDDSRRWKESGRYARLACRTEWWKVEPNLGRVADGVAARVDRLKAIGNGQVPAVAATAFNLLKEQSWS